MVHTLNCPSCAAPLDYKPDGGLTMQCAYCGNTIVLPENMTEGAATNAEADMTDDQLTALIEISWYLHAGKKIEAIKVYRQAFGVSLKEAKEAIEALEVGQPVSITSVSINPSKTSTGVGWGCGCIITLMILVPILITVGLTVPQGQAFISNPQAFIEQFPESMDSLDSPEFNPTLRAATSQVQKTATAQTNRTATANTREEEKGATATAEILNQFARPTLRFGTEGIGPGQFSDGRYIGVDGQGNSYLAEHKEASRIQKFSPEGEFISLWEPALEGNIVDGIVVGIEADRNGNVYVIQVTNLSRYNGETGELLNGFLVDGNNRGFDDVAIAPDGSIVTIWKHGRDQRLIRFDENGNLLQVVEDIFSAPLDDEIELAPNITVDGLGNIYILAQFAQEIFKFDSEGRFLDRFGSRGDGPGQFRSPDDIAVDGQGNVFVADGREMHVFDSNGRFIEAFEVDGIASGLAVNDQDELLIAARKEIIKYVQNER